MSNRIPFSEKLKKLMYENGESLERLADILNVTEGEIIDWRNGQKEPSSKNLIQLARYFKCSTDYLLGIEDDSQHTYHFPEDDYIEDEDNYEEEIDGSCDDETQFSEEVDDTQSSAGFGFAIAIGFFAIIALFTICSYISQCS